MNIDTQELQTMWQKLLGEMPSEGQFIIWAELYPATTIRHAFAKTGQKNCSDPQFFENLDHKIRFASKCMQSSIQQKAAGQRSRP